MAVFKNGIFAYDNGKPVTPQSLGISLSGIQTCQQFFFSGSISTDTQKLAFYTLVGDLETYGIWDKMKVIYPMVGQAGVSSSFQLNLKDPNTFRGTFYGSWNFSSTGATSDGFTGYMDTNYIQNDDTSVSPNNFHQSFYINNGIIGNAIGGVFKSEEGESLIIPSRNGTQLLMNSNNLSDIYVANTTNIGYFVCSRYQLNTLDYYLSGVNKLSTTNAPSTTKNTIPYYLGLLNNNGIPNFGNASRIALFTLGQGLTPTQAANLYTAVQRFQTTLGRQV